MIRVLVVADSSLARAGLEALLREDERFEVVTPKTSFSSPLRPALQNSGNAADVMLAELSNKDRLNSISISPEGGDSAPLVVLVDNLTRAQLLRVLGRGAAAILRRDALPREIIAAVEAAAAGLITLGPEEWELLAPSNFKEQRESTALEELTAREVEVLVLMAQGLANKNIADRLHVSEHTVKFHVSSILAKLGAATRTEAVVIALRDGLLIL